MKVLWVTLLVVLILFAQSEGKGKKPSKPCLKDDPKRQIAEGFKHKYDKFTETEVKKDKKVPIADSPCWWDLSRQDCGRCKTNGVQCGYPMHKWCQDKKLAKKSGCKGIPHNKFTKSSKGYPCYSDPKSRDCAWCIPGNKQCGESAKDKCGNFCRKATDMPCDGVPTTCENIPKCGNGASCDQKTKECKCDKGFLGNGFECFDKEGEAAANPNGNVDISIDTASQFFVFPNGSPEFPIDILE